MNDSRRNGENDRLPDPNVFPFQELLNAFPFYILLIDSKHHVLFANAAVQSAHGVAPDTLIGQYCPRAIHGLDGPFPGCPLEESVENGERIVEREFLDPTYKRWMLSAVYPTNLRTPEGNRIFVHTTRDITDRKQAEADREVYKNTLFQSEKLSAVGRLASGLAHEINNPLTVIIGFAQYMAGTLQEKDLFHEPVQSILQESTRAKKLLQDLLAFSRTSALEKEPVAIAEVIDHTLSLIEAQTKTRNIRITRQYAAGLPSVSLNKNRIQQVIMNVCNNAIEAMPDGGEITVVTKAVNGVIEVRVADTGTGMSEEVKQHLFEPFFTTKKEGTGTGLGLSLCYEIVHKHGGTINAVSDEGKGTTIVIALPIDSGDAKASPPL
jgi:PAS domain S-box-containing protein